MSFIKASQRILKVSLSTTLFSAIMIKPSLGFSWGAKGHQIVAHVGSSLATNGTSFWLANADGMKQLSTVPDRVWKSLPTASIEKPTHWFQADAYITDINGSELMSFPKSYSDAVSTYGESMILTNGTATWRIRQFYNLAVQALKAGNQTLALQYAGVMSHYIGDLAQPLHVTENYDGQKTGNKGIHSYFETTIVKDEMAIRSEVLKRTQSLLNDPHFLNQFNGDLTDTIMLQVTRSLRFRDLILKNDTLYGRKSAGAQIQLNIAKDRMADGAATLAMILSQLWQDAGLTLNFSPIAVKDPTWVPPTYNDFASWVHPMCPIEHGFDGDDCGH